MSEGTSNGRDQTRLGTKEHSRAVLACRPFRCVEVVGRRGGGDFCRCGRYCLPIGHRICFCAIIKEPSRWGLFFEGDGVSEGHRYARDLTRVIFCPCIIIKSKVLRSRALKGVLTFSLLQFARRLIVRARRN